MFTVTIKAGSPAEREQRVQDLLVKGYHVVKYIEKDNHGKNYHGHYDKRRGSSYTFRVRTAAKFMQLLCGRSRGNE